MLLCSSYMPRTLTPHQLCAGQRYPCDTGYARPKDLFRGRRGWEGIMQMIDWGMVLTHNQNLQLGHERKKAR